jgi:hypothetical protein
VGSLLVHRKALPEGHAEAFCIALGSYVLSAYGPFALIHATGEAGFAVSKVLAETSRCPLLSRLPGPAQAAGSGRP